MLLQTNEQPSGPAIDLTPVIDMVFLLLIFFLVATTFHQAEREMKIALPVAHSDLPVSSLLRELVINVDAEGRIVVGGKTIQAEDLRTLVADAVKRNAEQKVTVRGDRNTPYENVVRVLDLCKSGGIQQPYLDTILSN